MAVFYVLKINVYGNWITIILHICAINSMSVSSSKEIVSWDLFFDNFF